VRPARLEFDLIAPQTFDEAQTIADRFRADAPVIVDLEACEVRLARRLIDFCSGLVYARDGSLQLVTGRVLLLAPRGAELSGGEMAGLRKRGFFNQS
jgi:cell division inhibitor SepF